MSKPIEKGSFVSIEAHPEYGVGRVLAVESLVTRVIFPQGGLRVFRIADHGRLRTTSAPGAADVAVLDKKEADLARGIFDHLGTGKKEEPVKKKRASKKKAEAAE